MKRLSVLVAFVLMISVVQAQINLPGVGATPILSGFSPVSGSPGDHVTLSGIFSLVPELISVTFNGVPAAIVTSSLANITVAVPPGATTGLISVNVAGLILVSANIFTVPLPNIITFNELPDQTYGNAPFDLTATSSVGLPVSYTSSNNTVATVSDTNGDDIWTVTILGSGSTVITASQPGNNASGPAPDVSRTLVVHKADQFITLNPLPEKYVTDPTFPLTATASSGLGISFQSSNGEVASISGSTVTITGAGTTLITASQEGNANYNAAPLVSLTLVVNKADQTITTFNPLPTKLVTDPAFQLTATLSSGLTPHYSSSNAEVATISGSTVTIVGSGTTTITAFHEGNASYNAAPGVSQPLVVNKNPQTITFNELATKTFENSAFDLTALASSGLPITFSSSNNSVATVSGNTVTITGAGSTTITASQPGNATYASATNVSRTLTVNKADQTITVFNPLPNKSANDPAFQLTATLSSGLAPHYTSSNAEVATISGSTVTIVASGTTTITAFHEGNANYNAAPGVQHTLTVSKVAQTITFNALTTKTYGNAPFDLIGTSSSGLYLSYTSSDTTVAIVSDPENDHLWTITIKSAGTCNITASQPGNNVYSAATAVSRTLTINKANQTISFLTIVGKTLQSPDFAPGATVSSGLPITYTSSNPEVGIITDTNFIHVVGLGTSTITALQPGNKNYNVATNRTRVLTVTQVPQVITFATLPTKTFNMSSFQLTATVTTGQPIEYTSSNPAVAIIIGDVVMLTGVGTSVITASQPGDSIYLPAASVARTLTVNKGVQSITFDPMEPVNSWDGAIELPAYASSGLPVTYVSSNTTIATVNNEGDYWTVTPIKPGTANIIASQAGNVNWNAAGNISRPLVVKAHQTITFGPLPDKNRFDPAFTLSATASSGLPVTYESSDPSVASVTGNTVTIVSPGIAIIIASQHGNNVYSPAPDVERTLFIALAPPTLSPTFIEFTNVTETGITVDFVPGNGNKRLVVLRASTTEGFLTPVDNTFYGVGTYAIGTEMVMNVEGSQAVFTGLAPGTKYYVKVFEFNEAGSFTTYLLDCVLTGAQKTAGNTEGTSGGRKKNSVTETQQTASEEKTFDVQIFGNPFGRKLTFRVESPEHSEASIILTDLSGKIIHTADVKTNATIEIDKPMDNGVYFLKVSTGSGSKVSRVVKME